MATESILKFRSGTQDTRFLPWNSSATQDSATHSEFSSSEFWTNGETMIMSQMPSPPPSPSDGTSSHLAKNNTNSSINESEFKSKVTSTTTTMSTVSTHYNGNELPSLRIMKTATASAPSAVPALARAAPTTTSTGNSSHRVQSKTSEIRNSIIAGSLAGMTSCICFHPLDVVRTKIQASTNIVAASSATATSASTSALLSSSSSPATVTAAATNQRRPLAVLSHTFQNGGVRALYTGLSLPLAAQAVYKSTVLTANRITQGLLIDFKSRERQKTGTFTPYQLQVSDHFMCGASSGALNGILFVAPVEYVRSQLIQQHTQKAQGKKLLTNTFLKGPVDVIKYTMRTNGLLGLWRGGGVTIIRDSWGCGSFFVTLEMGQRHLPAVTGHERGSTLNTVLSGAMAGFGYWFASLPLDTLKTLVQTGKASSAFDAFSILVKRDGLYTATSQLYRGWEVAFGRGSPAAAVSMTTYSFVYQYCSNTLA
jgi:solute carrier family 25 carnitine/acylcarnitine transporter 20/29